jgi:hypothetical protein
MPHNVDCTRSATECKPSVSTATSREPFAALPHAIAGRPDITPTEKAVLLALLFWSKAKSTCWPSDASIGARIGRSVGTVQRALRRLEALGLIVRQKTADNPTGRLIVLVWVAERLRATPPSPALEPPAPPARDEGKTEKEEKRPVAGAGRVSPPLPAGEAMEEPDRATLHQWAEGADPILRRIARARLAELDQGPPLRNPVAAGHLRCGPRRLRAEMASDDEDDRHGQCCNPQSHQRSEEPPRSTIHSPGLQLYCDHDSLMCLVKRPDHDRLSIGFCV